MVHTVGLLGINGNVGAPTAMLLTEAAKSGSIKLVLFHRPGKGLEISSLGDGIQAREFDSAFSVEELAPLVKDINVFITAVGMEGFAFEPKLVEALSKSSELVTYIPSMYSTTWTQADLNDEKLGPIATMAQGGKNAANKFHVPLTILYTGAFLNIFLMGFSGAPVKANKVTANEKSLANGFPITSLEHIGQALTKLATSDPQSIKNKEYVAITFQPTGQELLDLYSRVNGKPATLDEWTDATRDAYRSGDPLGAVVAAYLDKWADNSWGYAAFTAIPATGLKSLEEYARESL